MTKKDVKFPRGEGLKTGDDMLVVIADAPTLKKDVSTSGVSETVEIIEERFVN